MWCSACKLRNSRQSECYFITMDSMSELSVFLNQNTDVASSQQCRGLGKKICLYWNVFHAELINKTEGETWSIAVLLFFKNFIIYCMIPPRFVVWVAGLQAEKKACIKRVNDWVTRSIPPPSSLRAVGWVHFQLRHFTSGSSEEEQWSASLQFSCSLSISNRLESILNGERVIDSSGEKENVLLRVVKTHASIEGVCSDSESNSMSSPLFFSFLLFLHNRPVSPLLG